MADEMKCPQCGEPLPPPLSPGGRGRGEGRVLEGLCPACLLKQGAMAESYAAGTDSQFPNSRKLVSVPAAPFVPPAPEELRRFFPQLEILTLLGRGGMGAVYKARQKHLDRVVALKVLPPGVSRDPAFAERFAREAQALAKLNHPHIVTLYESGQAEVGQASSLSGVPDQPTTDRLEACPTGAGGTPTLLYYFLMEYVDGISLRQLLNAGRMAPKEALAIVPQICEALQFAHDRGIVHRDIKPENILLSKDGLVKIADFGVAKIVARPSPYPLPQGEGDTGGTTVARPAQTEAGVVLGTPQYMAPEQVSNPLEVDHRADIYSLGVVFYQMLTGELPTGKFEPPSKKVLIDVRLDEIVLRALAKDPARRYQQVSEVKTGVETIMGAPAVGAADLAAAKTDAVLLERYARHRADEAFTELVRRHVDLAYSAALRQVRDAHLAEDVTQAVFTVLSRKAASLGPHVVLPAWLVHVTRCAALDALRRQARCQRKEREASPVLEPTPTATAQPEWQMMAPLLDEGLAALNETDRSAVVLRYFSNLPQHEVGTRLGISEDAAEKRVERALEKLRQFFAHRSVVLVVPLVASLLSHHAVQAAPAHLVAALPSVVAAAAGGIQITTGSTIAAGTLKHMAWVAALGRASVAAAVLVGALGVGFLAYQAARSSPDEVARQNAVEHGIRTQQAPTELRAQAEAQSAAKAVADDVQANLKQPLVVPGRPQEQQVIPGPNGPAPQGNVVPDANQPEPGMIDLLALIDPEKDAVMGKWQKQNGKLVSDPTGITRLEIPYQPPEEYDFKITFTRMAGDEFTVAQCLFKSDRHFMWQVGHTGNTFVGFERINGQGVESNPSGIRRFPVLTNGRVHTSEVRVRNTGLTGYLDGQPVCQWNTNYSDMGYWAGFSPRQENLLALATIENRVAFHTVEVREVTGHGRSFRTPLPGQPPSVQAGDQFVQEVSGLPAEDQVRRVVEKLKELNPGYAGQTFPKIEGEKLTGLNVDSAAVADLSPLLALPELRSLRVCKEVGEETKGAVGNLSALAGLKLTRLEIAGKLITDLAPLAGMPLESLSISGTKVADLTPLKGMPLTELVCEKTAIRDLAPLAGMKLKSLNIRDTSVTDLSALKGLPLTRLDCTGAPVTDLSPVKECPLLDLKCNAVPMRDADIVLGLAGLRFFNGSPAYEVRENWTALKAKPQELGDVAAGRKPVNLLALTAVPRDAVHGPWQRNPVSGELMSDGEWFARLEIPYQPPEEYDFEVQFTRVSGNDHVAQIAIQNGHQFTWIMGAYQNTVTGFEHFHMTGVMEHPNSIHAAECLKTGRRHTSVLQVRKDSLTAYLDGRLLTCWKTDGQGLMLWSMRGLRNKNTLGLSSHGSPTIFHAANLYEVTGQGKVVEVLPATPDTPVPPPRPPAKKEPTGEF